MRDLHEENGDEMELPEKVKEEISGEELPEKEVIVVTDDELPKELYDEEDVNDVELPSQIEDKE
jgi:hypothetical protein